MVIERPDVPLAHKGSMPDVRHEPGVAQGRAAGPLPKEPKATEQDGVYYTHILHNAVMPESLRGWGC